MRKKTGTSIAKQKEKRSARKQLQRSISEAMKVVSEANKLTDPMEPFPVFRRYFRNGVEAEILVKRSVYLTELEKDWIFSLTKDNMQKKYEQCCWGWDDTTKREELFDEAAWYMIAKSNINNTYLGFSHFRFDLDEGIEVLYCYELQLESMTRKKGLGKFMMQILELIAFRNNMKKVVLTVLKNNPNSAFFKVMGYQIDESSPIGDEELYPYEILSKANKKLMNDTQIYEDSNHQHN